MALFRTTHSQTLSTGSNQAVFINLQGGTAVRAHLFEINIGSPTAATPGADAAEVALRQSTTAPSGGTALDEVNTNPPGAANVVTGTGGNHTTDPTTSATTNLLRCPIRHEIPWRWLAYPGREIISTPTASTGLALVTVSIGGTGFQALGSLAWAE